MYLKADAYAVAKARRYAAAQTPDEQHTVLASDGVALRRDDLDGIQASMIGTLMYLLGVITSENADVTAKVEAALANAEQVTKLAAAEQERRDRIDAELANADSLEALEAAAADYEHFR